MDAMDRAAGALLSDRELQRLLDVGRALVTELDVESVLQRVLETARELTGAGYAALGILDERKEELERFLFVGIDDDTRRMIGPLPRGHGVLGELIRNPEPLRLKDVTQHPRSYGFPPGHPPMTSFLGVPIAIRGEAFGNLYLTDKADGGEFDESDQESAIVLADWAAISIDNARLYENVERRREELERAVRGLEATAAISRALGFETDLARVLELIVKRGRALVDARSLILLLEDGDVLRVTAAAGEAAESVLGVAIPRDETLAGGVLASGAAERVPNLADRVGHGLDPVTHQAVSAIVAPLGFRGRGRGVLVALDRAHGSPVFEPDEVHLLTSFAPSAAIAIATAQSVEGDRLRHSVRAAESERKRWARELHDETLQELGALKLMLESARRTGGADALEAAIGQATEQLELSIKSLQSLITELRPAALDELGIQPAVEALLSRTASLSGLEIDAHIDLAYVTGRTSTRLTPDVATTIYRVVQESLTNTVKHAGAGRVSVEIAESEQRVTVTVRDDGRGFDREHASGGFGLVGMRERVELVDGRLVVESAPGAGTRVRAEIPAVHEAVDGVARASAEA